jgi:hypothetical protein
MQPNQIPEWVMRAVQPPAEGTMPPVEPISINVALTDPDKAGHQWLLMTFGDGTMQVTVRLPWQNSARLMSQVAQICANAEAQAQARQGPSLIVPPKGADIHELGIHLNGKNPRGRG